MQSIGKWVIYAIIVAACIAVAFVVLGHMGIPVPSWVVTIGWIMILAIIGVAAIHFLMKLGNSA